MVIYIAGCFYQYHSDSCVSHLDNEKNEIDWEFTFGSKKRKDISFSHLNDILPNHMVCLRFLGDVRLYIIGVFVGRPFGVCGSSN